jgi:hypothetical protein
VHSVSLMSKAAGCNRWWRKDRATRTTEVTDSMLITTMPPPDASQRICLAVLLPQNIKDYELAGSSKNHDSMAEV